MSQSNEILEQLKFGNYTFKYIYDQKKKNTIFLDNEYRFIECNNCFIVRKLKSGEFSLFFYKPKKINYLNIEKSQESIFSTLQIDEFMKENSIDDLEFMLGGNLNYYSKQKSYIDFINEDEINFKAIIITNNKFELNNTLQQKGVFSPLSLSKYFYEYFEDNEPNKDFIYYDTPERRELEENLKFFYLSNLNYFNFCGPISGGKSTTLLKFKNDNEGVIYFNLKVIKKYYLNSNPYFKSIMLHELKRIIINDKIEKEVKEKLDQIMKNNILENIFIDLVTFLLSLNLRNILVFDQFKNIHFDSSILEIIENKISNSCIGLIISSSID